MLIHYNIFTNKSICRTLVGMKKFQVITLFPEMFTGVFESSMMWKAQRDEIVQLSTINLRDFGIGPRQQVDDTPYGGGDGMLLKPEPLFAADGRSAGGMAWAGAHYCPVCAGG